MAGEKVMWTVRIIFECCVWVRGLGSWPEKSKFNSVFDLIFTKQLHAFKMSHFACDGSNCTRAVVDLTKIALVRSTATQKSKVKITHTFFYNIDNQNSVNVKLWTLLWVFWPKWDVSWIILSFCLKNVLILQN